MNSQAYVDGLRRELRGAVQRGDKAHAALVKAELDRAANPPVETAVVEHHAAHRAER